MSKYGWMSIRDSGGSDYVVGDESEAESSSVCFLQRLKDSIEARSKMVLTKLVNTYNAKQQQGPLGSPYYPSAAFQWRSLQTYLAKYQYKPPALVPRGWR